MVTTKLTMMILPACAASVAALVPGRAPALTLVPAPAADPSGHPLRAASAAVRAPAAAAAGVPAPAPAPPAAVASGIEGKKYVCLISFVAAAEREVHLLGAGVQDQQHAFHRPDATSRTSPTTLLRRGSDR